MKQLWNETALLESWWRCAQVGLSLDAPDNLYPLNEESFYQLCQERQAEISAYRKVAACVRLPKNTASLLIDGESILMGKKPARRQLAPVSSGPVFCGGACWDKRSLACNPAV